MPAPQVQRPWTAEDEAFLREHFPKQGARFCATKLRRSRGTVNWKARSLGLSVHGGSGVPIEPSEAVDAAIRAAYRRPAGDGARARLAAQFGLSPTWISARALKIGARKARPQRRPWTAPELEIVATHAKASSVTISRALKAAGFKRSASGVDHIRKTRPPDPTDAPFYTIPEAADLLGVCKDVLHRWIRLGMLRPYAGGQENDGGRLVVSDETLARFIVEHPSAVDLAKIQIAGSSAWFIDLLARKGTVATLTAAESQVERIIALVNARPELLHDRRQVALLLEIPFESCTVTISQAIKMGRIQSARAAA
jgi:Helix-turn-helix domain